MLPSVSEDADDDLDRDLDLETEDKDVNDDELLERGLAPFFPFFFRSRERPLSGDGLRDGSRGAAATGDTPLFFAVLLPDIFIRSPSKSSMAYLLGDRRCCGVRNFTFNVFSLMAVLEFHTRLN